jgi:DNA-binding transcriptional regulator YdaS (Cro superfamily)
MDQPEPLSPLVNPDANAVEKAVYYAGGARKVAEALGISNTGVYKWCYTGKMSPEHVLALEKLCNGYMTRHDLRPDIYPIEESTNGVD